MQPPSSGEQISQEGLQQYSPVGHTTVPHCSRVSFSVIPAAVVVTSPPSRPPPSLSVITPNTFPPLFSVNVSCTSLDNPETRNFEYASSKILLKSSMLVSLLENM